MPGQIGYGQSLHEYLRDLYRVWRECFRVLIPGRRLCINIGDQFARAILYGRYKIIPLHAEIIAQCEEIGFDYMGAIIWQKKTTMNTTGGAIVMGSYPYPPNGMVELDYEYSLLFRRPGRSGRVAREVREKSRLTKEEWKTYFSGHWSFGGARQVGHEAMFPEELPRRLIRMYSFVGETVLDPFLGSGTTAKVALELGRNAVGYEINPAYLDIIREKLGLNRPLAVVSVEIRRRTDEVALPEVTYQPRIQDALPLRDPAGFKMEPSNLHRVSAVLGPDTVQLDTGHRVRFLGVRVRKEEETLRYLQKHLLRKKVFLKCAREQDGLLWAYVYLKNGIFVNSYLIRAGLADADPAPHPQRSRFLALERNRKNA